MYHSRLLRAVLPDQSKAERGRLTDTDAPKRSSYILHHEVTPEDHRLMYKSLTVSDSGLFLEVTLKYMGSTLCLIAWAFPTRASTDDTFSGSWRFSTTVLMAFITLRAWCRSWLLRSISSGSSMSWNWLKYCLADGKLTKNLRRRISDHFRL